MTRLSVYLAAQKKTAEIRTMIETEARKLQDAIEAKDNSLREVASLAERKRLLNKTLNDLEVKIKEKEEAFKQINDKKNDFLSSVKQETIREKKALRETQKILSQTTVQLENLLALSRELEGFIKKHSDTRIKYLEESRVVSELESRRKQILPELQRRHEEIAQEKKDLDGMKTYLSDLYGKLASYTISAKETLEYVNEQLEETGTPIVFRIPEGEIIDINIDNFNKEQ